MENKFVQVEWNWYRKVLKLERGDQIGFIR